MGSEESRINTSKVKSDDGVFEKEKGFEFSIHSEQLVKYISKETSNFLKTLENIRAEKYNDDMKIFLLRTIAVASKWLHDLNTRLVSVTVCLDCIIILTIHSKCSYFSKAK